MPSTTAVSASAIAIGFVDNGNRTIYQMKSVAQLMLELQLQEDPLRVLLRTIGAPDGIVDIDERTEAISKTYISCTTFLNTYFGPPESPEIIKGVNEGLRLACLGNPEQTVQGELLHFLRAQGIKAVSECGIVHRAGRRDLDITVFDNHWQQPQCVIELKHYSTLQSGKLNKLIRALPV